MGQLPRDVATQLDHRGRATWQNPDQTHIDRLDVEPTRYSDEHETALNVNDDAGVVEISATNGTSMRSLLRHPFADVQHVHLRLEGAAVVIDAVYVDLPIGCLSIKKKPRKSRLLSAVFSV